MVTDAYIRRKYEKFTTFWPSFDFPDFPDIDFGFRTSPGEFGSVEWTEHGIRLSLDPICQKYSAIAKSTLLHEMAHIVLGSKIGHGKRFARCILQALNNGAVFEGLI